MESQYWADQIAKKVIDKFPKVKKQTVSAGITPSGTIHIGNFREIITTDLIRRALIDTGAKVRHVYSWDDFDRFRKVPANMPNQTMLKEYIGLPVTKVPDPFGKCHASYADHIEKTLEKSLEPLGFKIEFIYQTKKYENNDYADQIKVILENRMDLKKILDKYRKEPLPKDYWPVFIFCKKCGKDFTKILDWDKKYTLSYNCKTCKQEYKVNFKKDKPGIVSLPWRADWPMRWRYEKVTCEGGGKEHNSPGGSLDTGHEIVKKIFRVKPPVRFMYDYIIVKGAGGKMAGSTGNVLSVSDVLAIYPPEVLRYIFAGTKPVKEFAIALDDEAFKILEDFYKCERIFYGKEEVNEREIKHWTRVYEMSAIGKPSKKMPIQPSYRHCIELINIHQTPAKALSAVKKKETPTNKEDITRYQVLLKNAKNWLESTNDDRYIFKVNAKAPKIKMTEAMKVTLSDMHIILAEKLTEEKLASKLREVIASNEVPAREFFQTVYKILIGKTAGPRLVPFIMAIGQEKVRNLINQVI